VLAVIETHPVQYHAPVYRALQETLGVPVTAIYGSDFSVSGHWDPEFNARVAWATDLLGGYDSEFLAQVDRGGAREAGAVSARGLRQALTRIGPAAVLVLGYSPAFNRTACREALRLGRPVLFRGETTDVAERRSAVRSRVRDTVLRSLYRQCARLLYIGQESLAHYRRLGCREEQLVFSPYCVDLHEPAVGESVRVEARSRERAAIGASANDLVLLFSGKLSLRKGVDLLVPAVASLPQDIRARTRLVFLGDGSERERVRQQASECGVTVHLLGFRDQRTLSSVYHAADVLVLPSRHGETWGLVVNEALHHGVPCVTSEAVGCHRDLVIEEVTGTTCRTESAEELGAAIARAVRSLVGRPEVRDACRRHVARYSVSAAAEGLRTAYEAVTRFPVPA